MWLSRAFARPATALVVVGLVVGLAQGCSSDDDGHRADVPDLPSRAELATYFGAVASYDPDRLAEAEELAQDGSPAQGYAAYLHEFATSAIAGGQPVDPAEATPVNGGYQACGGTGAPDKCVTWADLEGKDGRLTDFTVAGTRLDDSLVDLTAQPPIESPGLYTVQPEYAYRSPQSGTLFVIVAVTAEDAPLAPQPGIYVEQAANIDGVATHAPKQLEPGTSSPVVLAFPHAEDAALDGSVTFGLSVAGTPESVGFELSSP